MWFFPCRISLVTVEYFVPLLVISFAYARIAHRLWGSKTPGAAQDNRDKNILSNKKKVQTLKVHMCSTHYCTCIIKPITHPGVPRACLYRNKASASSLIGKSNWGPPFWLCVCFPPAPSTLTARLKMSGRGGLSSLIYLNLSLVLLWGKRTSPSYKVRTSQKRETFGSLSNANS